MTDKVEIDKVAEEDTPAAEVVAKEEVVAEVISQNKQFHQGLHQDNWFLWK